uniref:Uncharacterized protein LOC111134517 n=1 Tax=Crassostrea virginica TaxID=6565 RepID=A0A8B8EIQ8_CRAVI|nr:uncharacterized protein LOC111134517 [Crassostrea virginica]
MKVAFLLVLCLAAGSQANFFDDLKSTFQNIGTALTTTLHAVGDQAKVVGTNLLSAAKDQGSQLASQALQSLLMGTMSALQHPDTTSTGTKRSLSELLEQSKPLTDAAKMIVEEKMDKLSAVYKEALDRLKGLSSQLTELPAAELKKKVDQIVAAHKIVTDDIQTEIVSDLTKLFGHVLSHHPSVKRQSFTDALSSLGSGLASFFQPHIQAIQQMVSGVGESLKQTASAFHTSLTTGTHGTAIHDSASALAQHGQNALSALKDAVSDILQQTLTNMQPHIVNILQHGSQALTESLTHTGTSSENVETP